MSASTANTAEVRHRAWNGGGKCLDVAGGSTADGANVIQYTRGSGTNQQWGRAQACTRPETSTIGTLHGIDHDVR